jgi:hypothetical protein
MIHREEVRQSMVQNGWGITEEYPVAKVTILSKKVSEHFHIYKTITKTGYVKDGIVRPK